MEQENKIKLEDRLSSIYVKNKFKFYLIILIITLLPISYLTVDHLENKRNKLLAEKYVKAGIYLAADNTNQAKEIYKEIILSKNKFYSILALNTILEKGLISNKETLLGYFEVLENLNIKDEYYDLIIFKKALFLLKNSESSKANDILNRLI